MKNEIVERKTDATHFVDDGVEGYYIKAAKYSRIRSVAEDFADGYDHNDIEGFVIAEVTSLRTGESAYFAFDETGRFEWEADRRGGARGY